MENCSFIKSHGKCRKGKKSWKNNGILSKQVVYHNYLEFLNFPAHVIVVHVKKFSTFFHHVSLAHL